MAPIQHAMLQITNDLREDLRQFDTSLEQLRSDELALSGSAKTHVMNLSRLHRVIRTKVNVLTTILTTESDDILKDLHQEKGL